MVVASGHVHGAAGLLEGPEKPRRDGKVPPTPRAWPAVLSLPRSRKQASENGKDGQERLLAKQFQAAKEGAAALAYICVDLGFKSGSGLFTVPRWLTLPGLSTRGYRSCLSRLRRRVWLQSPGWVTLDQRLMLGALFEAKSISSSGHDSS